jgi:hypothetical protein
MWLVKEKQVLQQERSQTSATWDSLDGKRAVCAAQGEHTSESRRRICGVVRHYPGAIAVEPSQNVVRGDAPLFMGRQLHAYRRLFVLIRYISIESSCSHASGQTCYSVT